MCGIAGGASLRDGVPIDAHRVARMTAAVAHRGPDGEGVWVSVTGRACLGHRRLSIIDLATGGQPMTDPMGHTALTFNGEIYNYLELRSQLLAKGRSFRTASDTEVLLQVLMDDGVPGLTALRGMFAFGFWNQHTQTLLLARDRLGKKPLYYEPTPEGVYFCSSLDALRRSSPRSLSLDTQAMAQYLNLGYIPAPRTAFEGFFKLPAATAMEFSASHPAGQGSIFWRADALPIEEDKDAARLDALQARVEESVRLRLRSDVPLGVFLSGGVDSTLIAAMATKKLDQPLNTFTVGFAGLPGDESAHAAAVAGFLGTRHQTLQARADLLSLLPEAMRHFGEPFGDATALSVWRLAETTRAHATVVLTGDGGDELFGGYDWYFLHHRLSHLRTVLPQPAWELACAVAQGAGNHLPASLRRAARALQLLREPDPAQLFAAMRSHFPPNDALRLTTGDLRAAFAQTSAGADLLARAYSTPGGDALRRMRYADIQTYLADCMMPKTDVATMASGLEARAPLLDQDVAQYALTMPSEALVHRGRRKAALRALLARHVPPALWDRPKQGFTVPMASWLRAPASQHTLRDLANSDTLHDTRWFREGAIATFVAEHAHGTRDHGDRLYHLLALDAWLRQL